ncbi:MAG: hypothetical protein HY698_16310 [Deltaproteobacteria bacterium]|nr:hypothetical protein [Deltaproteobacteria bacterium]
MFLSKIWFFLVAVAATLGVGAALTMPRPAERKVLEAEDDRLARARWGTEMLLRENTYDWVGLASDFARLPAPPGQPRLKLDVVLDEASKAESISDALFATARDTLQYINSQVSSPKKPEYVIALDKWGRVVAAVGDSDKKPGDRLEGYFLVRDALRGYQRDDLWFENGKLYRVAAAPVIERQRMDYAGAIVIGDEVDSTLAKDLEDRVGAHVAFFVAGEPVVMSSATGLTRDIQAHYDKLGEELDKKDDKGRPIPPGPFTVSAGEQSFRVRIMRLPGEAGAQRGFYAVYTERPKGVGVLGTLREVTKDDISFGHFPWIPLGIGFLVAVVAGMLFMWMESDRPIKRLLEDAVSLGQGELQELTEEKHRGKYSSVARSVNIALKKLDREAKAARKEAGAVSAPMENGSSGPATITRRLPSRPAAGSPGDASPFSPPPPSDFSLGVAPSAIGSGGFEPGMAPVPTPTSGLFDLPPPPPPSLPPPISSRRPQSVPPILGTEGALPVASARATLGRGGVAAVMPPGGMSSTSPESLLPPPLPPSVPLPSGGPPPPVPPPSGSAAVRSGPTPPPPRATTTLPITELPSLDDDLMTSALDDPLSSPSPGPVAVQAVLRPTGAARADFGGATVVAGPSDDLLRQSAEEDAEVAYFRQVFDEFVQLKRKCGENTEGLTYEKFEGKLRQNREQLITKYNCKAVKFQVYVKDGKAALKATPVK